MAPSAAYLFGRSLWVSAYREFVGMRTLEQALETYGPHARARLLPLFRERGISYPPRGVSLLAIKDQALLELWAEGDPGPRYIRSYPIRALSGGAGPKLREGDRQVPEGLYTVVGFNFCILYTSGVGASPDRDRTQRRCDQTMDVIYGLIPGMILLGLVGVGVLFWAARSGQFEDLEGDAHRILMDDDLSPPASRPPEEQGEGSGRDRDSGGTNR